MRKCNEGELYTLCQQFFHTLKSKYVNFNCMHEHKSKYTNNPLFHLWNKFYLIFSIFIGLYEGQSEKQSKQMTGRMPFGNWFILQMHVATDTSPGKARRKPWSGSRYAIWMEETQLPKTITIFFWNPN